jgi:hypothetical protein
MKNKKIEIKIATILAFLFVGIGTIELFLNVNIAHSLDALYDGLDLFTIFPAHIFGTIFWWLFGNGARDNAILGWIGQFVGFVIYTVLFYFIIKMIKGLQNAFKQFHPFSSCFCVSLK